MLISSYIGSINDVCLFGFTPGSTTKISSSWNGVIGMKPWIGKPTHEILDSGGDACVNGSGGPDSCVGKGSSGDDGGCGVECFKNGLGCD
ncbi:hypothetical protein ACLB2K_066816 [Fragaria x ananassa]